MQANLISQLVSSSGTGALILSTANTGYTTVGSSFADGAELFYSVTDGDNREIGFGTYTLGTNSIARTKIFETIVAGVFDNTSPSAISLSGSATVSVSPSIQALTTHLASWKRVYNQPLHDQAAYTYYPTAGLLNGGIKLPYFGEAPVGNESISLNMIMGHDVKGTTDVYIGIHWTPEDNTTGVVRWGIEYAVADINGFFTTVVTVYKEVTVSASTGDKHIYTEFDTPISVAGPNTIIAGRFFRDTAHVNDTYGADAGLLQISGAYQAKRIGSPSRNSTYDTWS